MNASLSVPHQLPVAPLGRPTEWFALGVLLLVLVAVVIDRAWELRTTAERVGMVQMEGTVRSALGIVTATHAAQGRVDALMALDGSNPMALLDSARLPPSYLGELAPPATEAAPPYSWYFDSAARQLVYVVGDQEAFVTALPGRARAAYRIVGRYGDTNGNGRFDGGTEHVTGLSFSPVAHFEWRDR